MSGNGVPVDRSTLTGGHIADQRVLDFFKTGEIIQQMSGRTYISIPVLNAQQQTQINVLIRASH